ncbi:RNA polymerase sigma factor [Deminuibacter soli]|uniref:RNA polymerase sigma-70 factor n=1 Tax=Deminuibacter soli TaxID=2291815 RepID=A0A3E1NM78_9BACT|nr:RNA polymerase sigma-70 factor [Deminuibacter soli]RFM29029.1 RNA polymerase sigma-70 factor [Deminuibacter soli]
MPSIKPLLNHTEKELILLWQKGNEAAFAQLYQTHAIELLTIAVQKTNDREIAKELVQNVFVTLHNNKQAAHEIHSLRAWLYTILKYRILDHFRKELVQRKVYEYSPQTYTAAANDVETYIQTRELELLLSEEIKKLPSQCQTVFRLRREHELSNKEIARHLNISENTVEQHMRRALRILRVAFNIGRKAMLLLLYLLHR